MRTKLIQDYKGQWLSDTSDKDRFQIYRSFKSELVLSPYLVVLSHLHAKICLTRFRLGVSQLNVHRKRFWRNLSDDDLLCPFCVSAMETETHFLLKCPLYNQLRERYIPSKYYRQPSLFKLTMLLATENKSLMLRVASFLTDAFKLRFMFIQES